MIAQHPLHDLRGLLLQKTYYHPWLLERRLLIGLCKIPVEFLRPYLHVINEVYLLPLLVVQVLHLLRLEKPEKPDFCKSFLVCFAIVITCKLDLEGRTVLEGLG